MRLSNRAGRKIIGRSQAAFDNDMILIIFVRMTDGYAVATMAANASNIAWRHRRRALLALLPIAKWRAGLGHRADAYSIYHRYRRRQKNDGDKFMSTFTLVAI